MIGGDTATGGDAPLWPPRHPGPTGSDGAVTVPPPRRSPERRDDLDDLDAPTTELAPIAPSGDRPPVAGPARPGPRTPAAPPRSTAVVPSAAPPAPAPPPARWPWVAGGVGLVVVVAVVGVVLLLARPATGTVPVAGAPSSASSAPSIPPVPATSSGTSSGTSPRSTALVTVGGAAASDPAAPAIVDALDRHFSAINARDFAAWSQTVTQRRASSVSAATWRANYSSTQDSSVQLDAVRTAGARAEVTLSFVSDQDPSDAPADLPAGRICWASTWPAVRTGGRWVFDTPPSGSTTKRAC